MRLQAERAPAIWCAERRRQLWKQLRERRDRLARDAYGEGVEGGAAEAKVASLCGQVWRNDAVLDRLMERGAVDSKKSRSFVCACQLIFLHARRCIPYWILSGVGDIVRELLRHASRSFQDHLRGQLP